MNNNNRVRNIIIHGPTGCGKNDNAEWLRQSLGCDVVVNLTGALPDMAELYSEHGIEARILFMTTPEHLNMLVGRHCYEVTVLLWKLEVHSILSFYWAMAQSRVIETALFDIETHHYETPYIRYYPDHKGGLGGWLVKVKDMVAAGEDLMVAVEQIRWLLKGKTR
ncbi:hypothetical protein PP754_gp032 [Pectobacterium phage Possum]|uniref:Uncharacterized protein n=1 Tax=Pectobacterium phage Possum TaxID=2686301 RepID=A0A7T0LVV4_9CAUD|nr:hypothetical protein PP754_gp032 [Pectobacterium phage Possum]QPL10873.1 hypothetical protein Possum_00032 [Pectobacterium phage Possum]QPL10975.1 hypothetical protein Horatius_00032 [Pectobacterium phage Horatius]